MNHYALIRRTPEGTATIDRASANTMSKARRALLRALHKIHGIEPEKAAALGYSVEFQKPAKETSK